MLCGEIHHTPVGERLSVSGFTAGLYHSLGDWESITAELCTLKEITGLTLGTSEAKMSVLRRSSSACDTDMDGKLTRSVCKGSCLKKTNIPECGIKRLKNKEEGA